MKIEKRENSESEENENEVNVEKGATNNDDKIIKDDYYFKSLY